MRAKFLTCAALMLLAFGGPGAGQDAPAQGASETPEPLFVRLTVYPTASLAKRAHSAGLKAVGLKVSARA